MKIVVIGNLGESMLRFRGDLLKRLVQEGCEVFAYIPPTGEQTVERLTDLGVKVHIYPLSRKMSAPMEDWKTFRAFRRQFLLDEPDCVFCYTAKPIIYGSLAASSAKVKKIVSMVNGLGYLFAKTTRQRKVLRAMVRLLYARALKLNKCVIFQNREDRDLFIKNGLADESKTEVVAGSGINLEEYSTQPLPGGEKTVFLMVARLLREKGVLEYLEAAKSVALKYTGSCEFLLVGGEDQNPGSLKVEELRSMGSPVQMLGHQSDVKRYFSECDCFVLPSFYGEGVPRSALEALAVGRPIITTDSVGCRNTVECGRNGWLVEPRNVKALAQAMEEVLEKPADELQEMASASRALAETIFDVDLVNTSMVSYLLR